MGGGGAATGKDVGSTGGANQSAAATTTNNPAAGGNNNNQGGNNNGNNNNGTSSTAAAKEAAAANSLLENKDPLRVDETLTRIEHQRGVLGVLIINQDGVVIRSSLDNVLTIQYSTLMSQLAAMAKSVVRDLDPEVRHLASTAPPYPQGHTMTCSSITTP